MSDPKVRRRKHLAAPALLCAGAVLCCLAYADDTQTATLCAEAKALKDQGALPAAAALYRRALSLDSRCDEAHWGLAWVYARQGQRDEAVDEFLRVVELTQDAARRKEARAALTRLGVRSEETTSPPSPLAPLEVSLASARQLAETGRRFQAVRMARALIARGQEAVAARALLHELRAGRRDVQVCAAADPVFRSEPGWETRLRQRFAAAAGHLARQVPIDLELATVEPWEPDSRPADGLTVIDELRESMAGNGCDVVLGFVAERREGPVSGDRLEIKGYSLGLAPCFTGHAVVSEVIAERDGRLWRIPEANLQENLLHELGHLFGAVHVGGDSVMRAQPAGQPVYEFHALNRQVMEVCRWVDFSENFASLTADELIELADLYGRLAAGPAGDDGARFYRAIALTYLGRRAEAADEYRRVLETSPEDAFTHVNLGSLYEELGDLPAARRHWQMAAALGRPAEAVAQARAALERTAEDRL
jgi:tetratricopeptide (TPR) repeat protein